MSLCTGNLHESVAWHNERGKHGQYDLKTLQLIHASASQTNAIFVVDSFYKLIIHVIYTSCVMQSIHIGNTLKSHIVRNTTETQTLYATYQS